MRSAGLALLFIFGGAPAWGKLTHQRPRLIELAVVVEPSIRPDQEFESAVVLNKDVQACLRSEFLKNPETDLAVIMEGEITETGGFAGTQIQTLGQPKLAACLERALEGIRLEEGARGPFKMHIDRVQAGGAKAKTFILDLGGPKKFQ